MSIAGTRSRLVALSRDLSARWRETRAVWTDAKADTFQRQYMDGLFAAVERTAGALEKLDELVSKVRKDCE